jgi:hypothetical protein
VFVQLHLDDLVEAAIDGGKTFVYLFTGTADLIVYVGADVLALFFDETRKLLELGLFILWHASQYTIMGASTTATGFSETFAVRVGVGYAKMNVILQASDLQGREGATLGG